MNLFFTAYLSVVLSANITPVENGPTDPALARNAHAILKKYCYSCHGAAYEAGTLNVLDHDNLLAARGAGKKAFVTAGSPELSRLWDRMGIDGDMPPDGSPRPNETELETIRQWIVAGAAFPQAQLRTFVSEAETLRAIRDHQLTLRRADRVFFRYLTINTLYNNRIQLSDSEIRQSRAALSKVVNSLSWKSTIVPPRSLDQQQTVFAVDIRNYGWDKKDLWNEVVKAYPYGLKQDAHHDDSVRRLATEINDLSKDALPYVRADWFIATASRPPLYHTMLELPEQVDELRQRLNVSTVDDFKGNDLARAGMTTSNVSSQNRLLDRHHSLYGYYWESYDFKSNEGAGNLLNHPLGPKFSGHPFVFEAFEHDGGEIIFSLPNGLQGYLLVDSKGKRIDAGPLEIVSDSLKTSGTPVIVNGLSCMACHSKGVVRFKDVLRDNVALSGSARDKVQRIFPKQADMDIILDKDEQRFLRSLEAATAQFLQVDEDASKPIADFAEPVGAVARWYLRDLGPEAVAAELAMADGNDVAAMVRGNLRLKKLGLGPLGANGSIKRELWHNTKDGNSLFAEVAKELELGEPVVIEGSDKKEASAAKSSSAAKPKVNAIVAKGNNKK